MSRKAVRHAIADHLTAANIAGVGKVFAAPPKITVKGDAFEGLPAGTPSGSVIFVEVFTDREVREAFGGPTAGVKLIRHEVRLHLLARSVQPKAEDAMDDHDTTLDAILTTIRADRQFGAPTVMFQAGEGDAGIVVETAMPKTMGNGTTHIWSSIDFEAWELLNA